MPEIEFEEIRPFVWGEDPSRAVRPFLWAKLDMIDASLPTIHKVRQSGEGYEHRIIWSDNVGATVFVNVSHLSYAMLSKMYKEVRPKAEEIEYVASGSVKH